MERDIPVETTCLSFDSRRGRSPTDQQHESEASPPVLRVGRALRPYASSRFLVWNFLQLSSSISGTQTRWASPEAMISAASYRSGSQNPFRERADPTSSRPGPGVALGARKTVTIARRKKK
jgi:hypothetical protein